MKAFASATAAAACRVVPELVVTVPLPSAVLEPTASVPWLSLVPPE